MPPEEVEEVHDDARPIFSALCQGRELSRRSENKRQAYVDKMGDESRVVVTLDGLYHTNR